MAGTDFNTADRTLLFNLTQLKIIENGMEKFTAMVQALDTTLRDAGLMLTSVV